MQASAALKGNALLKSAEQELTDALASLQAQFQPNELAYLAATTKAETPFRDRLAFTLHQSCEPSGAIVAREWNRVDLAILNSDGEPQCLVELKLMYTFDALKGASWYTSKTYADEIKALAHARPGTAVYSLLLVTHLSGSVEPCFMKAVKYSGAINKAILAHGNAIAVQTEAVRVIDADLVSRNVVARGEVVGGSAFGVDLSILYWLVRNSGA